MEATHWKAKLERLLASRGLFVIELALILALGAGLALWLSPEPHSDWAYYWAAAGDASRYERGGVSLWLLAAPKTLGWSPVASALLLNLTSAAVMLWVSRAADTTRGRWFALLVALYLLLITPFAGIVQLDLVAATQMATGLWLVMTPPAGRKWVGRIGLASVMVTAGVATKPQFALTLWAMLGLVMILWWPLRRSSPPVFRVVIGTMLIGSVAGFLVDSGLRAVSGRAEAIRTNSAVTLYGGLLVSNTGQGCGYWSVEAAKAAKGDLGKPLQYAILDRLSAKPMAHWASVVKCKLPQILRPPPYALYWLVESPNIRARIDADPRRDAINSSYNRALHWERKAYGALTLIILLTTLATCVHVWRGTPLLGMLGVAWIASFWLVHLIFEIQGRYFLGMFLLAPLICALSTRNVRSSPIVQPPEKILPG